MANYHLHMKAHGKSTESGSVKSIASVVAYRHCFEFDGFNYTNKKGFVGAFLMVPENKITEILKSKHMDRFPADIQAEIKAKLEAGDVRNMWRSSAKHERRKDAQFCMEMEISLQHELTLEENLKNLRTLLDNHYIKKGLCADVAIHDSGNNLHAHVLITQRQLVNLNFDIVNDEVQYKFSDKKLRDDTFGSRPSDKQLLPVRKEWADLCNASFENAGIDIRISHLTLEEQRKIALEAGDFLKAAELDRQPARHFYRNESVEEQAKREAEAEKAEYYNEMIAKLHKSQIEMVEIGVLTEDSIIVPEFKPVIRTFADKLKQRTLERTRIIKENAERYFKDRTDRYARFFRKARSRAEEIIETTKSSVRSAKARYYRKSFGMDNQELVNSNELARELIATLDSINAEQQRSIEIDRRVSQTHQAEPVAKSSIDLDKKLESKIDEKMKPKLWFDPYQRPEFKPSWVK